MDCAEDEIFVFCNLLEEDLTKFPLPLEKPYKVYY